LIPLMLAATAAGGWPAAVAVSLAFSGATILTMCVAVLALRAGLSLVPARVLERHAQALAGASLVLCGLAVGWLGL
jgi:hypothetical protein